VLADIELSSTTSKQKWPRGALTPGAVAPERIVPMQHKPTYEAERNSAPAAGTNPAAIDRERNSRKLPTGRKLTKVKDAPGIYRRSSTYVVRWRDRRGRQHQKAAATLAEARVLRASKVASVGRGERQPGRSAPFEDYAREWVETTAGRTKNGLRDLTRSDYRSTLERCAIPFFGRTPIQEIGPRDLKAFARHLANKELAPNTVRLALAPVKAALAEAFEDELITRNPAAGIRIGEVFARQPHETEDEQPKTKALSEAELRRLLFALDHEWRPLVELLATTGLRISEALGLRWGDLDLEQRRLRVRRRVRGDDIDAPKSKYAKREVPLTPAVARRLQEMRQETARRADETVFTRPNGSRIERTAPLRAVHAAAKRAGLGDWVGLHTLRHSYASILFSRGCNAVQVQRLLGHHSAAFTLATYIHLLPGDLPDPVYLDEIIPGEGVNERSTRAAETGRKPANAA